MYGTQHQKDARLQTLYEVDQLRQIRSIVFSITSHVSKAIMFAIVSRIASVSCSIVFGLLACTLFLKKSHKKTSSALKSVDIVKIIVIDSTSMKNYFDKVFGQFSFFQFIFVDQLPKDIAPFQNGGTFKWLSYAYIVHPVCISKNAHRRVCLFLTRGRYVGIRVPGWNNAWNMDITLKKEMLSPFSLLGLVFPKMLCLRHKRNILFKFHVSRYRSLAWALMSVSVTFSFYVRDYR